MGIPAEIRAVERPKNTVVMAYGKNRGRYAVKRRVGCRYDKGRRLPAAGPTVGHIVGMKYVPIPEGPDPCSSGPAPELKEWANAQLCDTLFADELADLREFYSSDDALKIYSISMLRVLSPGVRDCELKEAYGDSFVSELRPGVALSRNTVSKFLNDVGKRCTRIAGFMKRRAARVGLDAKLLVDGTLKSDESGVNTLSDFSRKAKARGSRDISALYAFDLAKNEPVCSKCYPGNMLDVTAYEDFVSTCGVENGFVVADKGFPAGAAAEHYGRHPNLHYLNPVKRNSRFVKTHDLLSFEGILPGFEGVTFKKAKCQGVGKWLYAFRDAGLAAKEEKDWLERNKKAGTYDDAEFKSRQGAFGTVVLESDKDMTPELAYRAYAERWQIEVVMRYYKSACEFDETRVHDDYSVIASEFCDFLATVLTYRLINFFAAKGALLKRTYGKVMSILKRAQKVSDGNGGWRLVRMNPSHIELLRQLELLPAPQGHPPRPVGRPCKAV